MVKIIAHRGKFNEYALDNDIENIDYSIMENKFDIEIDVRLNEKGTLSLGHDKCGKEVPELWYLNHRIILHCKTVLTLCHVMENSRRYHWHNDFFFHDKDDCTLTNNGDIWVHPEYIERIGSNNIPSGCYLLMFNKAPEKLSTHEFYMLKNAKGICTDWPYEMDKLING